MNEVKIKRSKYFFTLSFILCCSFNSFSQTLFYQDVFYGGVTAGGFSTGQGSGSGSFNLYVEPGSTIKQAYLFTYRYRYPPNVPITINSTPYLFDTTNVLMQVKHKTPFASPVHLYYYDFTDSLNANITSTFNITIPAQPNLPINAGYWSLYIYIAYEHPALPKITTSLWVNDKDFLGNEFYNYHNLMPIDNSNPVSFSLYSDRTVDTAFSIPNSYNTYLNSNLLGTIGGADASSNLWSYSGVKGHFYYQNNILFGLDDDTSDSLMGGTDGLADIKSYINNNDTTFNFQFTHEQNPNNLAANTGLNLANILTYTTPCDTFTTTITANDTICFGDSVQLNATGGSQYSWFSPFSTFNDSTLANPIATPTQTTTYIVTITNDSGCVKTEHVKIWVNPLPVADTLILIPNDCGDSIGSITIVNTQGLPPFNYQLTNLQNTNITNQNTNLFDSLVAGNYQIQIIDSNGCQWQDTVTINEVNNVQANFTANPSSGIAPLDVSFSNTSIGANNFEWIIININGDTVYWIPACVGNVSNCGFSYTFDSSGTYQVCLIAYNNIPTCADTICKTIVVEDEISLIIPNVFTPNGDGENDNFVIQLSGATLLKSLKAEVFNRWGMLIKDFKLEISNSISNLQSPISNLTIWDGYTTAAALAPEGTYFYVISYETLDGETKSKKGSVTLLR